jgi:N6-L-threonylcarbamoyladenine synthase
MNKDIIILGIESSCDETAASVMKNGFILSNIIADQKVHQNYGGVIPEAASRAHQKNIIPVVDQALKTANIRKNQISAVAFTSGPGLLGSLLVGSSFAKSFASGLDIPIIEVNHMQAHILAHFIKNDEKDYTSNYPSFPFLCLTVSGGHTQIVLVKDFFNMTVIGETTDDAAGEAFDKIAKTLGLPYPGGPLIDKYAQNGNPLSFQFTYPTVPGYSYSFSGLKTAVLYLIRDELKKNSNYIIENINDICASIQFTIVSILLKKLKQASKEFKINEIAIAGGVSANSELRKVLLQNKEENKWNVFIPYFMYCTDNAAMIANVGYLKFKNNEFALQNIVAKAKIAFEEVN